MGLGISALGFAAICTGFLYLLSWFFRSFSKSENESKRTFFGKAVKEVGILSGFLIISFMALIFFSFRNEGSFEDYPGSGDYWRVPLQKPYQLSMIDGLDDACLSMWNPNQSGFSCIVDGITHCVAKGPYLIGKTRTGYFIFDQTGQKLESSGSLDSLQIKHPEVGVVNSSDLKTVRAAYNEHWERN